jgi:hypothetical protein
MFSYACALTSPPTLQFITDASLNLSSDLAMHRARAFLREMAQPTTAADTVALDLTQLTRHPSYVSTAPAVGSAAITSHPLQAVDAAAAVAANQARREAQVAAAAAAAATEGAGAAGEADQGEEVGGEAAGGAGADVPMGEAEGEEEAMEIAM